MTSRRLAGFRLGKASAFVRPAWAASWAGMQPASATASGVTRVGSSASWSAPRLSPHQLAREDRQGHAERPVPSKVRNHCCAVRAGGGASASAWSLCLPLWVVFRV